MIESQDVLANYERYRNSPWDFLSECVFTHDEVDQENPIKPFPSHFKYLYILVLLWLKHKKLAVPKSRRMTASWTFLALIVWDCIFHRGRSWAITSKKEEDAKELVSRCEFIIKHIPPDKIPSELIPKMKHGGMQSSPPAIEFGEIHSKIFGFPQGGNQLRQRGFSGIFEDEVAFQSEAEATFSAAEPTIRGGGRMVKVSSRSVEDGGFFKKIVFDQLDAKDIRFPELPPVTPKSPMEGVQVWINPKNQFCVADVHYSANPEKRGEEFRESIKRTMPIRAYRMEYEKSWETYDGRAVYEDFNERFHLATSKPKIHTGLPLLLGWDSSGLTPACIIAQLQEDRLFVVREIVGIGMGANRFVPHVVSEIKLYYPQIADLETQTISFFDPAGFKRNEISEETYVQAMMKFGFKQIRPGPQTWNRRVEGVTDLLIGLSKGEPKLQIWEPDCPTLVAGFRGGFRYPDSMAQTEPDKVRPVKDIHSHPHDALQYLAGGLRAYKNSNYNIEIPAPSYGFQKSEDMMPKPRRDYGR